MKHIVIRMSSYFPNRWPLSYLNLTKNMKTYIRRQQHKKIFTHKDIKQKEPPQKYRLGTISNTKLQERLQQYVDKIISVTRMPCLDDKANLPYVDMHLSQRFYDVRILFLLDYLGPK